MVIETIKQFFSEENPTKNEVVQIMELDDENVFEIQEPSKSYQDKRIGWSVTIKNKRNQVIYNFNKILPEGWIFSTWQDEDAENWVVADHEEREICLDLNRIKDKKGVLEIFHEIGHATIPFTKHLNGIVNSSSTERFIARRKRQANRERGAWVWALKKARQLKDDGVIDLFSEFQTHEEFIEWLHQKNNRLGNYENGNKWYIEHFNAPELKGIFSKKFYQKDQEKLKDQN